MPRVLPASFTDPAGSFYGAAVRTALSETFETLNEQLKTSDKHKGQSGTTCTVALLTGALLTVANVGDSEAVLDTFTDACNMTVCPTFVGIEMYNECLLCPTWWPWSTLL